VLSAENL